MLPGLELATSMVLELCGGSASQVTVRGYTGHASTHQSIFLWTNCRD